MALKLRLARGGAKKNPFYRIVVAENTSPRDGRFVEKVGTYNPMVEHDNPERLVVNQERVKHWLSVGAKPTDRVARMLAKLQLIEAPKFGNDPVQSKPKKKAQERLDAAAEAEREAIEAAKAAKEAAKAAKEAAKAEAAAPAVEAKAEDASDA